MKTTTTCPQTEELRQLIDGTLSEERQHECTQHMDRCECCQAKLEEIATDGSNLSKVVEGIATARPDKNSAYWPAVHALENSLEQTYVPRVTTRSREISLQFLQPASDPAYLGRLAQFDIMRVLGRGGMGLVLEAFDSRLQRNVAIKVLDPDLAGDEISRQRFCREARAAASITHENVVAVHQVERSGDEGLPYLVMQLVSGESLEQRLDREKQLPLREIVRIAMQAAHGLTAAHAQGMIHRDVKPGNILLEPPDARVKLTDFGLAHVADDVKLTRTGFVTGTPLYMSPEQALGVASDHRSDLFSLGAVMYEMCAGQPPFTGNSALGILKQISETKQRPIRELNPAIPDWFAETIDSLLAKKPEDRIQTSAQLAELLDFQWTLLKANSDDVPQVCQIEEQKRTRRVRWMAATIGTAFLTLGLLGGWLMWHRETPADALVSSAEPIAVLSANAGTVWSASFNPAGDTLSMAVEDGTVRLWDVPTNSVKSMLNAHRGVVWASQFSRDGALFATAGDDGLIKLWKPSETEPFKTLEHPNAVRGFAWASDDRTLFSGSRDGGLRVWSLDAADPIRQAKHPGAIYAVAISADDQTLATAGSDKVIHIWNANTLSPKVRLEGHAGPIYSLSFHRDGRTLASSGWDKTVRLWDTASGLLIKSWEGHTGDIWTLTYSPDGTKLATGGHEGAVKLWDSQTGNLLATYLGHKTAIHSLAFTRDGTRLASGGRDGAVRIWKMD